ncbi:MAG TPA: LPS export ABC transporter permease LptG [Steroidobacteraceae bacterium]|nr:LPS export ABC transporter permease LptG [Steroidobacteraceae bacterium]
MTIIDRYIVRAVLSATGLVMAVLLVLAVLIIFIGEQGDVGQGHYTALSALWYSLLSMPQAAWELLPIGALLGSLLGLGQLARNSELIVLRASGVSVARIAGSALIAGLILLAVETVLGELLASQLEQTANAQKALDRFSNLSFGSSGAWVRDGNTILNVERLSGGGRFGGMLLFQLSPDHRLVAIGHAEHASPVAKGRWTLDGYSESRFTKDQVKAGSAGERTLVSHLTASFLAFATAPLRNLTARALWTLIQYDRANALDPGAYLFAFWSRIARTLAIAFAVLLGVPFVLGALRTAAAGSRMMVGLVLGIVLFLLQRLIESGTVVFNLNPIVLAWIPTALLAVVSLVLLARAR